MRPETKKLFEDTQKRLFESDEFRVNRELNNHDRQSNKMKIRVARTGTNGGDSVFDVKIER